MLKLNYFKFNNKNNGFTLIELLVVIAIIGLLATISVIALNKARSHARDSKRLSDTSQIVTALEMYYNDNGAYPDCQYGDSRDSNSNWHTCLEPSLSTYMSKIPQDPGNNPGYYYFYSPSIDNYGQGAKLIFYLENTNPNMSSISNYGGTYNGATRYSAVRYIGQYNRTLY